MPKYHLKPPYYGINQAKQKCDFNFLLVKKDNYEVCQVGDLRLLRGLRDRQGAGRGEGDEEGGQRYQSKELDE